MYAVIEALGERDLKLSELLAAVAGAVQPGSELHTFWARRHLADCLEQQEAQQEQQQQGAAGTSSSSGDGEERGSSRQQGKKGRGQPARDADDEGDLEVEALMKAKMSSQAAAMAAATDMLPPVKSKAKQSGSERGQGQGGSKGFGGASASIAAAVRQADQMCLRAHTARYGALSEARWVGGGTAGVEYVLRVPQASPMTAVM
jgi:hypothetical protein